MRLTKAIRVIDQQILNQIMRLTMIIEQCSESIDRRLDDLRVSLGSRNAVTSLSERKTRRSVESSLVNSKYDPLVYLPIKSVPNNQKIPGFISRQHTCKGVTRATRRHSSSRR